MTSAPRRKDPRNREDWDEKQWAAWGLDLPEYQHVLTGPQNGAGRTVIFDVEGNGLFHATGYGSTEIAECTDFWCIAALDVHTGEEFYWGWDQSEEMYSAARPRWVHQALTFLQSCKRCYAHNGIGFDYITAEKLYGYKPDYRRDWDTLVLAKALWHVDTLAQPDFARVRKGLMPAHLAKRHSLEAWGYRVGTGTTDRKMHYEGGFHEWSPAQAVYLMGDIRATLPLWKLIQRRLGWAPDSDPKMPKWSEETVLDEHFIAFLMQAQQEHGVKINMGKLRALKQNLKNLQAQFREELARTFGSWWQPGVIVTPGAARGVTLAGYPDVTIRRFSARTGKELAPYVGPPKCYYSPDAPFTPIERIDYNPRSRQHLGQRLQDLFGWEPKEFGGKNKDEPKVDETTLEQIPEAVLPADLRKLILNSFVVDKTLAMVTNWETAASGPTRKDPWHIEGRIHGKVDPLGTITRRASHSGPNLGQTPAVLLVKDEHGVEHPVKGLEGKFGWECRELFEPDDGDELTGVDEASLELICLGHYLWPWDDGAFSARVCDPDRDAHAEHAVICVVSRADAKTTIYLFVYGGSAYKLSLDKAIKVTPDDIPELLGYRGLPMILKSLRDRLGDNFVDNLDDMQKARIAHCRKVILKLEQGIPGLKNLKKQATEDGARGWLEGFDGSRLTVRKDYAALNTYLQAMGAMACKRWIRLFHERMQKEMTGEPLWKAYKQLLWVHDEIQIGHQPGLGWLVAECAEWAAREAGVQMGLRGTFRTGAKHGRNWAECH